MELLRTVREAFAAQYGAALHGKRLLVAVSGGVDSMVLLHALCAVRPELGAALCAVTVNHNMREESVSLADVRAVEAFCAALGVPCTVRTVPVGELERVAAARGKGVEEAARSLRYGFFEEVRAECGADVVCVAHNRNDRLETLLERFLEGADAVSSRGMEQVRGVYFRPLFDVSRAEIEAYAAAHAVPFRIDKTNFDTSHPRNRIRHELMPFLDGLRPGWDTAVLQGGRKAALTAELLEDCAAKAEWRVCGAEMSKSCGADATDGVGAAFTGAGGSKSCGAGATDGAGAALGAPVRAVLDRAVFEAAALPVRIRMLYNALPLLAMSCSQAGATQKAGTALAPGKAGTALSGVGATDGVGTALAGAGGSKSAGAQAETALSGTDTAQEAGTAFGAPPGSAPFQTAPAPMQRVPYEMLERFARGLKTVCGAALVFSATPGEVSVSLAPEAGERGFYVPVPGVGRYELPLGAVEVVPAPGAEDAPESGAAVAGCGAPESGAFPSGGGVPESGSRVRARLLADPRVESGVFSLPAVMRSCTPFDTIKTAQDNEKPVSKILAGWKVADSIRYMLPVIEDSQVRGLWGEPLGFKNWFVRQ